MPLKGIGDCRHYPLDLKSELEVRFQTSVCLYVRLKTSNLVSDVKLDFSLLNLDLGFQTSNFRWQTVNF